MRHISNPWSRICLSILLPYTLLPSIVKYLGIPVLGLLLSIAGALNAGAETLTLDEALQRALETDERIDIQRLDAAIAGQEVNRAWTILSPRLSVSGQYERPEEAIQRDEQIVVPEDTWRASITARQPLFDARVLPARRLGLALEEAETWHLARTIQGTLFEVTQSYYQVLSTQQQRAIADQTVALAREEVARATARFEAGEARRTEVLRAEVDEARAVRNRVQADNAYALAQSTLARQIGWTADATFTVEEPPAGPEIDPDIPTTDWYAQAFEQRYDLTALQAFIRAAEEQLTVIRREAWPTLEVQYNHRFVDPESFSARNNFWDVAAVARFEFWDGGGRRISRRQQLDRVQQAELRVADLEKSIQLEVQQAWQDVITLRENLVSLRKEVALAEENYRTLSEQARVGLATSLDVSTALTELDAARTERVREAYNLEVAKQRLQFAAGGFASDYVQVEANEP